MKKRNKRTGPSLEEFLKEAGVLEETRAVALKETLAWQVQQAMEQGENQQGGDGAAYEHKPRGAGSPSRSG